ncbi:MAG: tryptophan synthase subunit alpha [Akkermansia sp.]|nr:tryptophan synthase subunit alpha [Akkermansia sp.]
MKDTILKAHAAGRYALIPYITSGYPSPAKFWDTLAEVDAAGADIIELGIPFSDPVADGPVIEAASRQALADGVTLADTIRGLRERKGQFKAKIVLMGYANPFVQYGLDKLAADCAEAGVCGFVIPDLPLEETAEFREAFDAHGLSLITLVGQNTTYERMLEYAPYTREYVYVVSVLGTTGSVNDHMEIIADTMRRARKAFPDVALAVGFGLHHPDQLNALPEDARPDAAIFGTALLRHIAAGHPVADFFHPWLGE